MKLALCVIVEGDIKLEGMKKLMNSVEGVFDGVFITANGKETKETESWCEEKGYHYSYLEWSDNFSLQRNYNFSQVPSDYDYIVWADSDDVIVNAHLLRDVAQASLKNNTDTVFFDYWYGAKFDGEPSIETFVAPELTHYRERIIKPGRIVWKKRIHETPVPVSEDDYSYTKLSYEKDLPIAWLHLGADRDISPEHLMKRMERNRRLLELELADERAENNVDPRTLLYLMKIYAEGADEDLLRECIKMGEEYLEKSGWDQERALCFQLMSRCHGILEEHQKANELMHKAVAEYPYDPLTYLHLSRTYFNLGNYRAMEHWMKYGLNMEVKKENTGMTNLLELKHLSADLMLKFYYFAKKNVRKAWESAKLLNSIDPKPENQALEEKLYDLKELDLASEKTHGLMRYCVDIQREDLIEGIYNSLPEAIKALPFANQLYNKYRTIKHWGDKEICYYASFGGNHFEKWDGNSVQRGIGGSETAVIRLSEEWTKMGYKVTVYGDPIQDTVINGVTYLPWYKFNPRDKFNIFIQWRNSNLARVISAKKYLVDLHDVFHESSHLPRISQIDKIMVKSKFHRDYAPSIPDGKMEVISNGI